MPSSPLARNYRGADAAGIWPVSLHRLKFVVGIERARPRCCDDTGLAGRLRAAPRGGRVGVRVGGDSLLVLGRFHELLSFDASKINGKIKCDSALSSSWCRQTKIDYLQTLYLHCA